MIQSQGRSPYRLDGWSQRSDRSITGFLLQVHITILPPTLTP
nr:MULTISPECIES: hypothetical protein [unclassified Arthrospira]